MKNFCLFIFIYVCCFPLKIYPIPTYYCTAADENFYSLLENLIGSIHKNDPNVEEIAVYDLGLNRYQKKKLSRYYKVRIFNVEKTNSQILEPIITSGNGRKVRGLFSWKHVILKDAIDRYPYYLYLDAGLSILKNPQEIFLLIQNEGYFFLNYNQYFIKDRITSNVVEKIIDVCFKSFKQDFVSGKVTFHPAGVQGISKKIYENYVLPLYNFSKKIDLYIDDGTAALGYGAGRHDQTLSTILIHINNLKKYNLGYVSDVDSIRKIHCHDEFYNDDTVIFLSQAGSLINGGFRQYIKKIR